MIGMWVAHLDNGGSLFARTQEGLEVAILEWAVLTAGGGFDLRTRDPDKTWKMHRGVLDQDQNPVGLVRRYPSGGWMLRLDGESPRTVATLGQVLDLTGVAGILRKPTRWVLDPSLDHSEDCEGFQPYDRRYGFTCGGCGPGGRSERRRLGDED
jgi:hypothetical protein